MHYHIDMISHDIAFAVPISMISSTGWNKFVSMASTDIGCYICRSKQNNSDANHRWSDYRHIMLPLCYLALLNPSRVGPQF